MDARPDAHPRPTHDHDHAPVSERGWADDQQVEWYVNRIGTLAPRVAGEAVLAELLPPTPTRVLDLGCGDGRLTALVLDVRPSVTEAVAVDLSEPMLRRARERFAADGRVEVREGDLGQPMTTLGRFDLIVSGFAIHHVDLARRRTLFAEIADQLEPHGVFANLEVVASATPERHREFLTAIGRTGDDPEDKLVDIETQLTWMREAGLTQVDCLWRWRGFALLVGESPTHRAG